MSTRSSRGRHSAAEKENSERWLLTYADMLTLLFALFIVMYGVASVESSGKLRQLEEQLKSRFDRKLPFIATATKAPLDKKLFEHLEEEFGNPQLEDDLLLISEKLMEALKKSHASQFVKLRIIDRGLVLSLLSDNLFFDLGSSDLAQNSPFILDKIAKVLNGDSHEIRIEGHTCDLPILPGSRLRTNWELSTLRAARVAEYLIRLGGVEPSRISLVGYGEFRPLLPNNSDVHRRMNRRVDIILLRKSSYTVKRPQKYKLSPFIYTAPRGSQI